MFKIYVEPPRHKSNVQIDYKTTCLEHVGIIKTLISGHLDQMLTEVRSLTFKFPTFQLMTHIQKHRDPKQRSN